MNTKKLVPKVDSTAFAVLIPIGTLCRSATKPAAHIENRDRHRPQPSRPNTWSSRLGGLPTAGAALWL
jgi:hypothetical protein